MLKSLLIGFAGALLGGIVLFLSYTAYMDHQIVRALLQIEQARQASPPAK